MHSRIPAACRAGRDESRSNPPRGAKTAAARARSRRELLATSERSSTSRSALNSVHALHRARPRRPAAALVSTSSCSAVAGQPRVDAGHRQAIGFAAAMRRGVRRAPGQRRAIRRRHRPDAPRATAPSRVHAAPPDRSAAPGSACRRSVPRMTSAVTNGLPSRSPPIQLPWSGTTPVRLRAPPSSWFSRSSSAQCSRGTSCRNV